MPSSCKSDGSIKTSTKITMALKWKASKLVRAVLPKKKQKGPTGDTRSLLSTETTEIIAESISNRSEEPTVVLSNNLDTDTEENVDAELGTPLYMFTIFMEHAHVYISDHLKKDWNTPIYAFVPNVDYDNG